MKPTHIYNIIIQASNAQLWDAIINPEITQHYFFNLRVESEWVVGKEINFFNAEGDDIISGSILEINPISKVVYSFRGHTDAEDKRDPDSRVTFEIEELNANACRLIVIHDEFERENTTYKNVGNGWPTVLSGLKTYLETGEPLVIELNEESE